MKLLPAYDLLKKEEIPDILSTGYLLRHRGTGARVALIENEDENKVFNIAFRTTPENSTGVAHIMEHSVLCGSREFPAKDPFVELVKGSMNTFLNAMTYSDKTMFPVASCNDKDFRNLMHVYLDAVFYPNIYSRKQIFLQEGWHYEAVSEDSPLEFNGVVYNEMKGAFSSADDVLDRQIQHSLFPDTTYGHESGGDPEHIPDLSYEEFLRFHETYYHPSNSYIYLYGKMDFEERLNWIDEHYLSHFGMKEVHSEISEQPAFDSMRIVHEKYPIAQEEGEEKNTYLAYSVVAGKSDDTRLAAALDILEHALLEAPGAPLKEILLEEGIGTDVMGSYDSGILQPVFSVIAKGADASQEDDFIRIIRENLKDIIRDGIDRKALRAAINQEEFKFREADFGSYPKGLMYGIDMFDTWLYDDMKPFEPLRELDDLAFLKEQMEGDYFEQLLQTYLLDNTHASLVVLAPDKGMGARTEKETEEKLEAFRSTLTQDQLKALVEETEELHKFQETPSTQEELEKIPMLSREDLRKDILPLKNEVFDWDGVTVVHHDYQTNGIAYIQLLFDASAVQLEDMMYLSLLRSVLTMVDTEHFTYKELFNDINMNTGGIIPGISTYPHVTDGKKIRVAFGISIRTLEDSIGYSFDMVREILSSSDLGQEKRLIEIIRRLRSRLETKLVAAGSASAAQRCLSYVSFSSMLSDVIGGISYYRFLRDLEEHFKEKKEEISSRLRAVLKTVLNADGFVAGFTGDKELLEKIHPYIIDLAESLPGKAGGTMLREYPVSNLIRRNEGFKTSAKVQYVARGGNFCREGLVYTGVLKVLRTIMSYEYLWTNVRVVGGAYGCSASFSRNGDAVFVSYRDPHLRRTNEVYEGIPAYLREFTVDPRDMTKYVIGTVSDMDVPMMPFALGLRSMIAWMSGLTEEQLQKERDQVLSATQEDIRALAPIAEAILNSECICVIGGEEKISEARDMFAVTGQL